MADQLRWTDRLDALRQDARFAVRTLRKNPAFTIVTALTLALGIGMNAAIFSVVNGVLLKPLALGHPDRLVRINQLETINGATRAGVTSPVLVDDWRAQRKSLVDLAGYYYGEGMTGTDLVDEGDPQRVAAAFITPGFWNTLGVSPLIGRVPRDDEMVRGSNDRLIVLSYAYWQRQFGGAQSVLRKRVTLGNDSYEIVGVMPQTFAFPKPRVEMYIPYSTIPDNAIPRARPVRVVEVVGRLQPGVSVAQAGAEMNALARRLSEQYPEVKTLNGAQVIPLRDAMVGKVRATLLILLAAVGFVLLIAAANLASLMLARATTRERELAIRAALGAERSRLIAQLFTESLMLAAIGGILGVIIARVGGQLLVTMASGQLPRAEEISLDGRVLAFTAGVSLLTGIAFGLLPAMRASSPALQDSLRAGSRGSTLTTGGLRSALVVAEVALAMILVVGAGLMTRSFVKLMQVDLGFSPDHRIAVNFTISTARHSTDVEMRDTYRQMLERVRAIPGVLSAGAIRDLPFRGDGEPVPIYVAGEPKPAPDAMTRATLMFASDGFFNAMGIPLLAGRDLSPQDRAGTPLVFVVNQAFAKRFLPGKNPIGQMLTTGDSSRYPIVGLVADVRQTAVDETPTPRIYASVYQIFRVRTNLVVRTQGDPQQMFKRIGEAIRSVDPTQPITSTFALDDAVSDAVARPRLLTVLLGLFGAMGLVLGALGLYGVLSYLVNQRTREIGVRLALGAQRHDVLRMVVNRGLALASTGVAVGLVGALVLTRVMRGVLYGVTSTDPLTFAGVALALLLVATIASVIPALRATRVDPLVALRSE
ncbi:MAG TPA: ABC transporter permease [Gemmatimonadaceae bacterium]|jgi:predicted permease